MVNEKITIENARIAFRNFSGKPGKYNAEGDRNFCVMLEPDIADTLSRDNWNVRWLNPRNPQDEPQGYIQVKVNLDNYPPKVVIISSKGKTSLDFVNDPDAYKMVDMLDWAEIKNVDLIIRPYNWEVNGKSGVKAYLNSIYITLEEDEFERKYSNIPDSSASYFANDDVI